MEAFTEFLQNKKNYNIFNHEQHLWIEFFNTLITSIGLQMYNQYRIRCPYLFFLNIWFEFNLKMFMFRSKRLA